MKPRITFLAAILLVASVLNGCSDTPTSLSLRASTPAFAKGGGGGTPVPGTRCATITVVNNPQTVRRWTDMPDIKYSIENCGTDSMSITLSVAETAGFLSELCPSPVAAPVTITLSAKQKPSGTTPVYRGPCGMTSNVNGTRVEGINRWQGHNLLLTITDAVTGVVYGGASFNWQDDLNGGI